MSRRRRDPGESEKYRARCWRRYLASCRCRSPYRAAIVVLAIGIALAAVVLAVVVSAVAVIFACAASAFLVGFNAMLSLITGAGTGAMFPVLLGMSLMSLGLAVLFAALFWLVLKLLARLISWAGRGIYRLFAGKKTGEAK